MKYGPSPLPEIRWSLSRLMPLWEAVPRLKAGVLQAVRTRTFAILLCAALAASSVTAVVLNTRVIQIVDGKSIRTIYTFQTDPQAILRQSGIHLSQDDAYAFTGIQNHYGRIQVLSAFPVSVTADGMTKKIMVARGTAADALKKAGIRLGTDDTMNMNPARAVVSGMHIVVSRVHFQTSVSQKPIPYQTQTKQDPALAQGTTKVLSAGQNGIETVTLRLKYVDGKMAGQTQTVSTAKAPVSKQIAVGTANSNDTDGAADGIPSYSRKITGVATAYTQAQGTYTSTGRKVKEGLVAVDPRKIPYGSKLYIATPDGSYVYGTAVAADTGGFVHNGSGVIADLFFSTQAQCEAFGRKTVNIYVLN